jgi:tetratricopeptide (TPR) repeat protein
MKRHLVLLSLMLLCACRPLVETSSSDTAPAGYEQALDLIHAFSGSGDQLTQAMNIAKALEKSHPSSGYSQTLLAEALSTWELEQDGTPEQLREDIVKLADEALRLNPKLAQAHVAKARALVRASMYKDAYEATEFALTLDPKLSGAIFLRAEVFRRMGKLSEAEVWYRKFIDSTPSRTRKSNGYYWLAHMYDHAARANPAEAKALTANARNAYEQMVAFDPDGAWKMVNFAIFLNGYAADFDEAERYAEKALSIMEFPMARYHLAAARYQKVWAKEASMDRGSLQKSLMHVHSSTAVSLEEALRFRGFSSVVRQRLQHLQLRAAQR